MHEFKMCTVGEKNWLTVTLNEVPFTQICLFCSKVSLFPRPISHVRTGAYMLARGVLVPMHIVLVGIQATCLNHYYTSFFCSSEGAMVKLSQVMFVQTIIRALHWINENLQQNIWHS